MSQPRPYDLSSRDEIKRLIRETIGYLGIIGTDIEGRQYAVEAWKRFLTIMPPGVISHQYAIRLKLMRRPMLNKETKI